MNCLRCGRETQDEHVFCDSCRETMEKYPVRPGTAVMLPKRVDNPAAKKQKRHSAPAPEEQIRKLRKQRRRLGFAVLCLTLALVACISAVIYLAFWEQYRPGQNYSAVVETTAAP